MNWRQITVPVADLVRELERIRRVGGVVTRCTPGTQTCVLTYYVTPRVSG